MKARSSINNFDLKSEVVKTVAKLVEDILEHDEFPFLVPESVFYLFVVHRASGL